MGDLGPSLAQGFPWAAISNDHLAYNQTAKTFAAGAEPPLEDEGALMSRPVSHWCMPPLRRDPFWPFSGPNKLFVFRGNFLRQRANDKAVLSDLAHRRNLCGGAGQPALFEIGQFFGHDMAFVHGEAHVLQHPDHRLPCDAVQDAIGLWRMHFAVFHEEDICSRRFGHIAAIIQHHRV